MIFFKKNQTLKFCLPVRAAEICMDEVEVQTNIIRTLSILSEIESCCEYMAGDAGRLGILLISYNCTNLCSPEKALSAISRLGYILGNIHAKFDESRVEFFNNDAAMECLLNTLEFFSNQRLFSINFFLNFLKNNLIIFFTALI